MSGAVICGVDDSGAAAGALPVARGLAARYELPLHLVHVVTPHAGAEERAAGSALAERAAGATATWEVETGHPADQLVAVAEERGASFLVVGCHGPRSSLLGSVSAEVSRRASCPVVVVPETVRQEPPLRIGGRFAGGIARFGLGRVHAAD
ncbi:MAG TPA: universal stress protein [Gaiellaceae bacterium]|jgi:nucleotide-binding universal stress UspA family protein|nr:universal stress protein [Gaiellaceae bacterium]